MAFAWTIIRNVASLWSLQPPYFPKKAGSYTSILLSEHFFYMQYIHPYILYAQSPIDLQMRTML